MMSDDVDDDMRKLLSDDSSRGVSFAGMRGNNLRDTQVRMESFMANPNVKPAQTNAMLKKIKSQMQTQVDLMTKIVRETDDDIDGAEEWLNEKLTFMTKVPNRLKISLKEAWPNLRAKLLDIGIEAELDLIQKIMKIESTPEMETINSMVKAKDLLRLLSRGFPAENALLILQRGFECDFIKIGGQIASKEEFHRRRERLIGPQGSTLKAIELLTGTYLLVYGNTVCVLGKGYDGINCAGEIILDCFDKVNPISHIRRLILIQELNKDEKIEQKDHYKFLPPVKKKQVDMTFGGQNPRNVDFTKDPPSEMTYGRRIALNLMEFEWYYPKPKIKKPIPLLIQADDKSEKSDSSHTPKMAPAQKNFEPEENEPPSLEKAWIFFEHTVLPRFIIDFQKHRRRNFFVRLFTMQSNEYDAAEPGDNEHPTRLYSWFFTPLKQMGDFGLGIGLYFSTLRSIAIMSLIAGCINIPNMLYFNSERYDTTKIPHGEINMIKASALCKNAPWVPCPTCDINDWRGDVKDRIQFLDEENMLFPIAKKNDCNFDDLFRLGMFSYATMIFIFISMMIINRDSERMEVEFDEDEQTAQDYSIMVENPPSEAKNPDDWKAFFERVTGGHVTVCTVAVDNDILVNTLVERRVIRTQLQELVGKRMMEDENELAKKAADCEKQRSAVQKIIALTLHPFGIGRDIAALYNEQVVLTSKVRGLSQITYPATKVYVTFETENAQRTALTSLSVGKLVISRQNTTGIKKKYLWQGKYVLNVVEPEEPSTVRWQDLNAKFKARLRQITITTFVSLVALALCALLVISMESSSTAAIIISINNSVFPMFAKGMTQLESHPSESGKQSSMYVKIALFRWVNTAIVISLIVPFEGTLMDGKNHLIATVRKIFWAEIFTINLIQLFDVTGHLKRHFLAPRAKDQTQMNKLFLGTTYELAERYTNMTKILFLAFCYCSIYPGALFMCSIALFINYYTDSFSLMYSWAPAPKLGNSVSQLSRKYFFSFALIALACANAYFWSGFPFDSLCVVNDGILPLEYFGTWNVTTQGGKDDHVATYDENTVFYQHCSQNIYERRKFPAVSMFEPKGKDQQYMTKGQHLLADIFGWSSVVIIGLILFRFVAEFIQWIILFFKADYEPSGDDMHINFSNVDAISSYIPQVRHDTFLYPLIISDISKVDPEIFDWSDPENSYSTYDLTLDAQEILDRDSSQNHSDLAQVFSRVIHYKPNRRRDDDSE